MVVFQPTSEQIHGWQSGDGMVARAGVVPRIPGESGQKQHESQAGSRKGPD